MFSNKFTTKDPLVDSVMKIMEQNARERQAEAVVNEKFGIQDRKALPHERQDEWKAAVKAVLSEAKIDHPNKQKLDVHEPEKDELTKHDFKKLRMRKIMARRMSSPGKDSVDQSRNSDLEEAASMLPKNLGPGSGQQGQREVLSPSGNKMTMSNAAADNKGAAMIDKLKNSYQELPSAAASARAGQVQNTGRAPVSIGDQGVRRQTNKFVPTSNAVQRARTNDVAPGAQPGENKLAADMNARKVASSNLDRQEPVTAKLNVGSGMVGNGRLRPAVERPRNLANFPGDANGRGAAFKPNNNRENQVAQKQADDAKSDNDDLKMPANVDKVKLKGGTVKPGNTPADTGGDLARNAAKNAEPAKIDQDLTKTSSWSQKVGAAMKKHVQGGGKAGDTIDVEGKKIKVSWKDKPYQKRLADKYSKGSAQKAKSS